MKSAYKTIRLKKIGSDQLMQTAYHEAGHALIDVLYGFNLGEITIIPNKKLHSVGSASNIWTDNDCYDFLQYINDLEIEMTNEQQLEYLTMSLMAGIIGEAFYSGAYNWEGANRDFNNIIDHFLSYMITDVPDLQPYWDKAFNLIKDNSSLLHTIANDLYENKTLTTEYFKELYDK